MINDRVDILLAAFNGEEFIGEQIESILYQTHSNIFLYIGDDGSTDSTREIAAGYAEKYPDKVFFAPFSERVGLIENFSRIAELSEAAYLMLADQDDIWFPDKVQATLKKMKEMEQTYEEELPLLVFTDCVVVDKNLSPIATSYWDYTVMDPRRTKLPQLMMQCVVVGCTAMFNRSLYNLAFPIPAMANMHDYWLGIIAGAFGKIEPLKKTTLFYRVHGNNVVGAVKKRPVGSMIQMIHDRDLPRGLNRIVVSKILTVLAIYKRCEPLMDKRQKTLFRAFIKMKNRGFFHDISTRLRYGFLRGGLLINLHDFFVSLLMGQLPKKHRIRL